MAQARGLLSSGAMRSRMALASTPVRAVLMGTVDPSLEAVLADVLADLDVELDAGRWTEPAPDLILAVVGRGDAKELLATARIRGAGCPVIAILLFGDDRLEADATSAGAHACYALDTPLSRLKTVLLALLVARIEFGRRVN